MSEASAEHERAKGAAKAAAKGQLDALIDRSVVHAHGWACARVCTCVGAHAAQGCGKGVLFDGPSEKVACGLGHVM